MSELQLHTTEIPGLFVLDLPLHGDSRGWFKENYQKEKMEALGLPPFDVVQNNFSYNLERGVTRGLHAEPWEKFISVAKKWLRRIAMAYMLGFANAINQEVKMVDDTFFKTEEVEKDKHD